MCRSRQLASTEPISAIDNNTFPIHIIYPDMADGALQWKITEVILLEPFFLMRTFEARAAMNSRELFERESFETAKGPLETPGCF